MGIEHDREEPVMGALAYSGALWILAFLALTVVFMLPTLIGLIRRVDRLALVFLVNVIGGLTGIGIRLTARRRPEYRSCWCVWPTKLRWSEQFW